MAIRFRDQTSYLGRISCTLAEAAGSFSGTFTALAPRTGAVNTSLSGATASFVGLFTPAPNRTGTMTSTLQSVISGFSGTFSLPGNLQPVWQGSIGTFSLQVGVPFSLDLDTICTDPNGDLIYYSLSSGALPAGIVQSGTRGNLLSGTPTTVQASVTANMNAVDTQPVSATEIADWTARSTGPGVVWSHNFDTAAEVNQFRWVSNYGSAPNVTTATSAGFPVAARVAHQPTDGFGNGGCLEITIPAGSNADAVKWWRPFSALPASNNGRASADPAASGTTAVRAWTPSNGTDPGFSYQKGYYGHITEQSLNGPNYAGNTNVWDGTDFWVQCQVKISASRFNPSNPQGKLIYLDIMGTSGEQEVLVRSNTKQSFNVNRGQFDMYTSFGNYLQSYIGEPQGDSGPTTSRQPGGVNAATCLFGPGVQNCWEWPADTWVTLLFHITPGQNAYRTPGYSGGDRATWTNAPKDTALEVYAAYPGDTTNGTRYTKIWSKFNNVWQYDESRNPAGFNAFIFSAYINALNAVQTYTQKLRGLIFSKRFVPLPLQTGHYYTTDFAGTEFPLSEGGAWVNTSAATPAGLVFTKMRKAPVTIGGLVKGLCYGSNGANDTYDDSYAIMSGFGPDQTVEVTVYKAAGIPTSEAHEIEILLRAQEVGGGLRGYEILLNFLGGIQVMKWSGPVGGFSEISTSISSSITVATGGIFKCTMIGNTISVYYNNVLLGSGTDSTYTNGNPGTAAFKRVAGANNVYGITNFTASSTT